jgi:hypothetical protein
LRLLDGKSPAFRARASFSIEASYGVVSPIWRGYVGFATGPVGNNPYFICHARA